MLRRHLLGILAGSGGLLAGCGGPVAEVTERPTGEVDVTFRTEADRDVEVALELLDGDGRVVDDMTSGFPPDQTGAPSFYAGGLARGPYALTVETAAEAVTVEWSVEACPRLELTVTVEADAGLRVERRCVATGAG